MNIETILNALVKVSHKTYESNPECETRLRQYIAFRARILKMDGELEASEAYLVEALELMNQHWERIQDLKKQLADKDERFAKLKNTHEALVEHHRDDHHKISYLYTGGTK